MKHVTWLLAGLLSAVAHAQESKPNVNSTSWEIYGLVALVFIVAIGYAFWRQKRDSAEAERKQSKRN